MAKGASKQAAQVREGQEAAGEYWRTGVARAVSAERRVLEIQTKLHRWASDDPHRRFDDLCELCEHGATVAVHQVATLSQLGGPGPGQPAWAALMERMRPKTLIVCAPSHEHIHANSIEHAA